jgi:endonuclease YncB( thermonuclease family)
VKHIVSQSIYVYACQLIRVIDGDTLVADVNLGFDIPLQRRHIRLHDIDVYEHRGQQADWKGKAATQFVAELFEQQGSFFYLHSVYDRIAIYNRIEGDVYLPYEHPETGPGFIDLKNSLIQNGYQKDVMPSWGEFDPTTRVLAATPAFDIMEVIVRKAGMKRSAAGLDKIVSDANS